MTKYCQKCGSPSPYIKGIEPKFCCSCGSSFDIKISSVSTASSQVINNQIDTPNKILIKPKPPSNKINLPAINRKPHYAQREEEVEADDDSEPTGEINFDLINQLTSLEIEEDPKAVRNSFTIGELAGTRKPDEISPIKPGKTSINKKAILNEWKKEASNLREDKRRK